MFNGQNHKPIDDDESDDNTCDDDESYDSRSDDNESDEDNSNTDFSAEMYNSKTNVWSMLSLSEHMDFEFIGAVVIDKPSNCKTKL